MLMVYAFGWVDTLAFDALGIMAIVIVSQQDQKKYPGHVED